MPRFTKSTGTPNPKEMKSRQKGKQQSQLLDGDKTHPGTTKVEEQASDDLPKRDSDSRGTFQWSRTSPGEPSGHFHGTEIATTSENLTMIPEHLKTFREH
ncbi:hypothetical protein CRG98_032016 [Punica granatum]|uniref:Uncharacterized protein n=1 Tax=Punica granatum TaxID=22663 RepID=A0A2I0IUB7_PUNGR|nr:hypothetical protein CRG98_032016 [Punica granatum]